MLLPKQQAYLKKIFVLYPESRMQIRIALYNLASDSQNK